MPTPRLSYILVLFAIVLIAQTGCEQTVVHDGWGYFKSIEKSQKAAQPQDPWLKGSRSGDHEYSGDASQFTGKMINKPIAGSMPEFDLSNLPTRAIYTWLIASYEGDDVEARRLAAEHRVSELRGEEHHAFYLHTESTSMVTIGAYDHRIYEQKFDRAGNVSFVDTPELRRLRNKFPNMHQHQLYAVQEQSDQPTKAPARLFRWRDPFLTN